MIRKIARPMLASFFIYDGVDTLRNSAETETVAATEKTLQVIRKVVPPQYASFIPADAATVARGLAGTKIAASSLFALGKAPRINAAIMAATHLPALAKQGAFITNTAMLGALFIVTQDTEGNPSLRWRAQKAGARTAQKVQQALPTKSETEKLTEKLAETITETIPGRASELTSGFTSQTQDWLSTTADSAKSYVEDNREDWEKTGRELLDTARANTKLARKSLVKTAAKAQDRADDALAKLAAIDTEQVKDKADKAKAKARKSAEKLQKQADKHISRAMEKFGDLL